MNKDATAGEGVHPLLERILLFELEREKALFERDFERVEDVGNRQLDALKAAAGIPIEKPASSEASE